VNTPHSLTDWRKSSRSGSSGDNCVEVCDVMLHEMSDYVEGGSA
jgi:hypothetical protein